MFQCLVRKEIQFMGKHNTINRMLTITDLEVENKDRNGLTNNQDYRVVL